VESPDEIDYETNLLQPGRYTEEDFLNQADVSPFKKWATAIHDTVRKDFLNSDHSKIETEVVKNPYYSEVFANEILSRYIPIFPLWSSQFIDEFVSEDGDKKLVKTSSTIENRFRILKHLELGGRKQRRIDHFAADLLKHTISVQRLSARNCLRQSIKKNLSLQTVEEKWNKKVAQPLNLKSKCGQFQRASKTPFKILKSVNQKVNIAVPSNLIENCTNEPVKESENKTRNSFDILGLNISKHVRIQCPMPNLGNTCWFNSVLQALNETNMIRRYMSIFIRLPITVDNFELRNAQLSLLAVFKYLHNVCNNNRMVSKFLLEKAINDVVVLAKILIYRHQGSAMHMSLFLSY